MSLPWVLLIAAAGFIVNSRLALAKATGSHLHAFGIAWDDASGRNNGHFAAFDWKSSQPGLPSD